MSSPFQPERTELPQSSAAASSALSTEYANMIQSTQRPKVYAPLITSPDGKQLVFGPLAKPLNASDQSVGSTSIPGTNTDAGPQTQPAAEQAPQSVAYNPNLAVPAWQRWSQTPVDTNGNMLPAEGPPDPGPMIPMYERLAPPGMYSRAQPQQENDQVANNTPADTASGANDSATPDSADQAAV